MDFKEYQKAAVGTAIYPAVKIVGQEGELRYVYPALGLCGEAGEVAEKVKKLLRDAKGELTQESKMAVAKELGDVLWYVAALSQEIGVSMDEVAVANIAKLSARKAAGTLGGSGDNR